MIKNDILLRNYNGELGTFIGELHEKNTINYKYYQEYRNELERILKGSYSQKLLDREMTYIIFFTYNYFVKRAFWNSSACDLSIIKGQTDEKVSEYIEELSEIIEKYMLGKL